MLSFLSGLNTASGRARGYTRQLLADIEAMPAVRRAMVLAMAVPARQNLFRTEQGWGQGILDAPLSQPRQRMKQYFVELEWLLEQRRKKMETLSYVYREAGGDIPDDKKEYHHCGDDALMLWLVTVGAALSRASLADVRKVWSLLEAALPVLPAAIDHILAYEERELAGAGTSAGLIFSRMARDEWEKDGHYIPAFVRGGQQR